MDPNQYNTYSNQAYTSYSTYGGSQTGSGTYTSHTGNDPNLHYSGTLNYGGLETNPGASYSYTEVRSTQEPLRKSAYATGSEGTTVGLAGPSTYTNYATIGLSSQPLSSSQLQQQTSVPISYTTYTNYGTTGTGLNTYDYTPATRQSQEVVKSSGVGLATDIGDKKFSTTGLITNPLSSSSYLLNQTSAVPQSYSVSTNYGATGTAATGLNTYSHTLPTGSQEVLKSSGVGVKADYGTTMNYTTTQTTGTALPSIYTQTATYPTTTVGDYTSYSGGYTNYSTSPNTYQFTTQSQTLKAPESYSTQPTYTVREPTAYIAQSSYIPASNVDTGVRSTIETNSNNLQPLEVNKQSRQYDSISSTGQSRARDSILSPYRKSMYAEFELVEDLPDRSNLIQSINTGLQKSPARESLLASPSRVSIKRQSMLSPAEIEVETPFKEKYEDGTIYEGEGRNGKRHGRGRVYFKDGKIFEGTFRDGRAEGKGIFYYKNGKIFYEGEVNDTVPNGVGVIQSEAPVPFTGSFDYSNFGNIGSYWTKYEGDFKDGQRNGKGTLYLTNGERFTGEFRNDKVEGKGTFFRNDGRSIQGVWSNSVLRQTL